MRNRLRPPPGWGGPRLSALLPPLIVVILGCRGSEQQNQGGELHEAMSPVELSDLDRAEELLSERRYEDAADLFGRLRDALGASGEDEERFRAALGWARARLTLGHHQEARESIPEIRSLARGDPRLESRTSLFVASVLHREGDLENALIEAQTALERAREAQDSELEVGSLSMLGTVHSLSGRNEEALAIDEELVALRRESDPGSRKLALQLNEVGIDYRNLGRYVDAKDVFDEALSLYRAHGDVEGQAMVLYNLSVVQAATGQRSAALENKLESLKYAEQVGHAYGLGLLNNDLGRTFLSAGRLEKARAYLERALSINRQSSQSYGETSALESLGRLELAANRPGRARVLLLEALKLAEENGHRREAATVRLALSETAAAEGRAGDALELSNDALEMAKSMQNPAVEFEALEAEAVAWETMGRFEEAATVSLRAIDLLESWRGRLALGDLRMGVADPRWNVFEIAVRCLMERGRIEESFDVTERARARLLLELLAERGGDGETPPGLRSVQRRLTQRFAEWESSKGERREALSREIDELTAAVERIEEREREESSAVVAARLPTPRPLSDLRSGLVGPDRAMISFFWGERDAYGWWIDNEEVRGARLGRSAQLRPPVEFLRAAIQEIDSPADWRPAAWRVYDDIIAPLSPRPAREIVVLPDGPLSLVPFEVLHHRSEAAPWGAVRKVVYGPSASVLAALAPGAAPKEPPKKMLALGFSPGRAGEDPPMPGDRRAEDAFAPIPEALSEARFVYELFPSEEAQLLLGPRATREDWLDAKPRDFRYIHFATHATVSRARPEDSYLLLSNGSLSVHDIRGTELRATLVTLSACDTALGSRIRGEGIVGFSHAFLAAGARAALVSLWRVDDRGAAAFMRDFYRAVRGGSTPADALHESRLARIRATDSSSHPSVWAPFVLVGW